MMNTPVPSRMVSESTRARRLPKTAYVPPSASDDVVITAKYIASTRREPALSTAFRIASLTVLMICPEIGPN